MSEPVSSEIMLTFYHRMYPFKSIFTWLNQQNTPTRLFTHREFAFTLQDDVYLRYQSFSTDEDLKKQVCQMNPTRFEIGPVYSARPRDKKSVRAGAFTPLQRELVFDIDMTDYDPVRTCCSDADICRRCWGFIACAVRIIDGAIREQFGFQHLLWVYSGRRGIHLWISDKDALDLTDDQRKAMVGWLSVIQSGNKETGKKIGNLRTAGKLPPALQSALDHLASVFTDLILADQNPFESDKGYETLLELIPDANGKLDKITQMKETLRRNWSEDPDRSSEDKWDDLRAQARKFEKGSKERIQLAVAMEDIILQYCYPRLDTEVSKHRNHLLKAPFCVHPKTGRVCVPIDPTKIDEFDPEDVPTVGSLLQELDSSKAWEAGDWQKTSLKKYVDMLDTHNRAIMESVRRQNNAKMDMTW